MDFLLLLILYCVLFVVGSLCLLYRDSPILCTGPIGSLRQIVTEYIERLVPSSLQFIGSKLCHYLLYKRTAVFQLLFLVLCILAHAVWLVDMIPILYHHYPHYNHTLWPLVAVFTNYFFWHKAWTGDPGEIKSTNCSEYMQVYHADGILYKENTTCSTCQLKKPARSKHCSICNRCVYRFDHHCIWTNNCVGGLNHRYFIMFMVSLLAMFLQGVYVGSGCVLLHAEDTKLFQASFIDDDGSVKPITVSVAFQHLFMALPRLVFLIIACLVLIVLVGVFLMHHLYLIFTNQTTNERHKLQELKAKCDCETKDLSQKKRRRNERTKTGSYDINHLSYRPFSQGIVSNILEVFLPHNFIKMKIKPNT